MSVAFFRKAQPHPCIIIIVSLEWLFITDMQAFRAANPGALFEDFIRWYSPNDWVPDDQQSSLSAQAMLLTPTTSSSSSSSSTSESSSSSASSELSTSASSESSVPSGKSVLPGQLSTRMRDPANLWQVLWTKAPPEPVSRQAPLFDLEASAERALHYLETLPLAEVLAQLAGVAVAAVGVQSLARVQRALGAAVLHGQPWWMMMDHQRQQQQHQQQQQSAQKPSTSGGFLPSSSTSSLAYQSDSNPAEAAQLEAPLTRQFQAMTSSLRFRVNDRALMEVERFALVTCQVSILILT
jgi:hypothetical protein